MIPVNCVSITAGPVKVEKKDLPESQTPAMSRFEQDLKAPFPESFYNSGKPITSLARLTDRLAVAQHGGSDCVLGSNH